MLYFCITNWREFALFFCSLWYFKIEKGTFSTLYSVRSSLWTLDSKNIWTATLNYWKSWLFAIWRIYKLCRLMWIPSVHMSSKSLAFQCHGQANARTWHLKETSPFRWNNSTLLIEGKIVKADHKMAFDDMAVTWTHRLKPLFKSPVGEKWTALVVLLFMVNGSNFQGRIQIVVEFRVENMNFSQGSGFKSRLVSCFF